MNIMVAPVKSAYPSGQRITVSLNGSNIIFLKIPVATISERGYTSFDEVVSELSKYLASEKAAGKKYFAFNLALPRRQGKTIEQMVEEHNRKT